MKKALYTCLTCLLLIVKVVAAPVDSLIVVRTTAGQVQGNVNSGASIYIFKGIPYAAPPVGDLRWKEPQPVIPWKGVRKCTVFGPNAMQTPPKPSGAYGPEILIPDDGQISEDCLYLNIWAPAQQDGKRRPVIVVIHGGGFTAGSGSIPVLTGEELAKKGAVVVSINYRLGIFGFLAHPGLSAESPHHASGNYGILDQIAALKWVKENIAAFGGDPNNITANGGSAGSCSIHVMLGSPLAKGLFRRVISESGPLFKPGVSSYLKDAEQEGLTTMNKLSAHTVAEMRAITADKLLEDNLRRHPVIDGYVLSDKLINIFLQGKQNDVDLLIGYNEGDSDMGALLPAAAFIAGTKRKFGSSADTFLRIYPAGSDEEAVQSQLHMSRDLIFAWENYMWAKLQSKKGQSKAYFYYFRRGAPGQPYYGAFHGSQGAYAFHNLHKWNRPFEAWDQTLSNAMSSYWINFAATGDPNGKNLPFWPRFIPQGTKVLEFGDQIKVRPLPAMSSFAFFEKDPQVALTGVKK